MITFGTISNREAAGLLDPAYASLKMKLVNAGDVFPPSLSDKEFNLILNYADTNLIGNLMKEVRRVRAQRCKERMMANNQTLVAEEKQAGDTSVRDEFFALAKPLIKHLNDHYHPHHKIIITPTSAEILEGGCSVSTNEFVKD